MAGLAFAPHAHVAIGVEHAFHRQDAIGGDEVHEEVGVGREGGLACGHALGYRMAIRIVRLGTARGKGEGVWRYLPKAHSRLLALAAAAMAAFYAAIAIVFALHLMERPVGLVIAPLF